MTLFNIAHVLPHDNLNLRAYHEVIDTVRWGLHQLGHDTTYSVNALCNDARNIIFGGHRAPAMVMNAPDDTIYYNLEQIRGNPQFHPDPPHFLVNHITSMMQVWEYSAGNMPTWDALRPARPVRHVPIGYAPLLTHIEDAPQQDIDVLIYGTVAERRLSVFSSLAKLTSDGISTVFACGLWGAGRDNLIARSRIILNVNHLTTGKIFEIVRASYLMANSKAIVADVSAESFIELNVAGGIVFTPIDRIAETCQQLLADEPRRLELQRRGFACISQRDIRPILASALD